MSSSSKKIRQITFVSIFVAIITVISQISIPTPSGVPLTLQIFAVAFCGYYLDVKQAAAGIIVYLLLGLAGAPVFSGFRGGIYVLLGPSGGFIWGFIFVSILCSISSKNAFGIVFGEFSVAICHFIGVFQYMLVAKTSFWTSFVIVSLPYVVKDMLLILMAYVLAKKIKKRILPEHKEKK